MIANRLFRIATRHYSTRSTALRVLGIETSCDDTSAAVVTSDRRILSEVRHGQRDMHEPMGGIVPTLASLGHSRNLPNVICQALEEAKISVHDLDGVAVTRGPGLPPCLPVGLNAGKTLAAVCQKPLIGVHHMEAHALTARLTESVAPAFPFMTLLISGGHTILLTANRLGDYEILADTLDNAVGEAIDKTARALSLPWEGSSPGPALERAAAKGDPNRFLKKLPTPLLNDKKSTCAFSFSGLKTAVARLVEVENISTAQDKSDVAAAFQARCIGHIEQKLKLALDREITLNKKPLSSLIVSGGVASNQYFRDRLQSVTASYGLPLVCPPPKLCTDNGAMIAWAGIERLQAGLVDDYTITTLPKWSLESLKDSL
ncbi:glycoprotease/Kae1 family metallohydrolase [Lichtheimia hyalospora FSU 10163]|nr:glycoprotease/Kae1 family metallohydrolase [Lichtheimia hyalospora FSU 10163]